MCQNENIYYDLSAPQLYSIDLLKKALNTVGSEKIILGSDCPYGTDNIEVNIERLKNLSISTQDMNNILSENIIRVLNI